MIPDFRVNTSLAPSSILRAAKLLGALLLAVGVSACQSDGDRANEKKDTLPVVDITAVDYAFGAPDTIPAGWVTFRMRNRGEETHHFQLRRLPEGRTYAEWREEYDEPVDSVAKLVAAGKIDEAEFGAIVDRVTPDWGDSLQNRGGMTSVAPGRTGQTTQVVEPGHYVLACVIRAPSDRFHAELGMVDGLVAVDSSVGGSPPTPDVTVRAAGREIRMDGPLSSGTQTIGLRVEEVPEGLQGGTDRYYAVTLARLRDTTTAREAAAWDIQNPPPFEALGGVDVYPPNQPAYMTADLKPGRYAWIWSYAGMDLRGDDERIVKEFTVEEPRER